ncbi:MAG: hypothetical protein JXB60_04435 [Candidatus Cloacimonetes bacterium]|nr:hypothetical protein [Candidatus Cloacimonadota bacterium]
MTYLKEYRFLKEKFDQNPAQIDLKELGLRIYNREFTSYYYNLLPGEKEYSCLEHHLTFKSRYQTRDYFHNDNLNRIINISDSEIEENKKFIYSIFQCLPDKKVKREKRDGKGRSSQKGSGVIILLHGLNEKDWSKYLPWARKLAELTQKKVILFPIAFHMNRAPASWSDPKTMRKIYLERKELSPNLSHSSFANTAMSTRLQMLPQRFLWSGLQTYHDIIELVREIKNGYHPLIHETENIDFFAYSVGSFLAILILMSNPYNYFSDSRVFNFCGGPTLNRMNATSKFILDSEANIAVYSFFIEHLEKEMEKDERLAHYCSKLHPIGTFFRSMLDYHKMKDYREKRLHEIARRIMALALLKDEVVPSSEVLNTLRGERHNIPIRVRIMDFKYEYNHVVPFPGKENIEKEVNKAFLSVFKTAARFLK